MEAYQVTHVRLLTARNVSSRLGHINTSNQIRMSLQKVLFLRIILVLDDEHGPERVNDMGRVGKVLQSIWNSA